MEVSAWPLLIKMTCTIYFDEDDDDEEEKRRLIYKKLETLFFSPLLFVPLSVKEGLLVQRHELLECIYFKQTEAIIFVSSMGGLS